LIPRPATETLVMASLERLKTLDAPRVVDIGTGSGCVAISLAKHLKTARFVATDVSAAAIELARRNAANNGASDRIDFRLGDLFAPVPSEQFDAIVSNPPYIPSEQIATLAINVRDHEPRAALDGGPDGLKVIRRLIADAAGHLTPGGWLLFEIGAGQERAVQQLIEQTPSLKAERTIPDGDGIPRVAVARLN
jgi:release factor glutamine methyltransferase